MIGEPINGTLTIFPQGLEEAISKLEVAVHAASRRPSTGMADDAVTKARFALHKEIASFVAAELNRDRDRVSIAEAFSGFLTKVNEAREFLDDAERAVRGDS